MTALARIVALLGLLCVTLLGTAAEPAPPPRPVPSIKGGVRGAATARDIGMVTRVSRPRGGVYITSLTPDPRVGAMVGSPVDAPVSAVSDTFQMLVYAPNRPIRVQVTIQFAGKTVAELWRDRLRVAFDYFDRDQDGFLNGFETQHIFSDTGLSLLMQSGIYQVTPQDRPSLDRLDTDSDRRVSFEEFVAYYQKAAGQVLRGVPPFAENPMNAQTTEALFKLLDQNGDGKLSRDEVKNVERLLSSRDADEDECLSINELLPNPNARMGTRQIATQPAMRAGPSQDVAVYEAGKVPGTVTQKVLKQYDKNGDYELTLVESGFDDETFRRLDTDGDGRLSGDELDVWRTGPPDLEVMLSISQKATDCKAAIVTDANTLTARGFQLRQVESSRLVVRSGRQALEFWAFAPLSQVAVNNLRNQVAAQFQQAAGTKGYVEEKDLYGPGAPQTQFIRVLFDDADANADGRLTREEFNLYFDIQQQFLDIAMTANPAIAIPTLFQLLDENRDGRLGVRELRTAWDRLIALEPAGSTEITRAAIQPVYSLRLTKTLERYQATNQAFNAQFVTPRVPEKGPMWFRKMDRNGDGDVSRAEFLGTKEEFDAIDTDGDGLIDLAEAETFDKKTRTTTEKK